MMFGRAPSFWCILWRRSVPVVLKLDGFGGPTKREVCVCVCGCGRPAQGLVCRAIRPFASHAALPEVPCTAAAVFGLLQQASTVVNFSVDDYTALPDSILMLTPHQRISSMKP